MKSLLQAILKFVDETPPIKKQKLKIYSLGICPRLNWVITINEFSLRLLDTTATKYLKRWTEQSK